MDNLDASIPFSTNHAFTVEARSNESFSLNAVGPESSVWPIIVAVNAVLFASNDWSEVSYGTSVERISLLLISNRTL